MKVKRRSDPCIWVHQAKYGADSVQLHLTPHLPEPGPYSMELPALGLNF